MGSGKKRFFGEILCVHYACAIFVCSCVRVDVFSFCVLFANISEVTIFDPLYDFGIQLSRISSKYQFMIFEGTMF